MITIKQAARPKRAVLTGAVGSETAEVRTDDKLRVRRFVYDLDNKIVEVYLAIGHTDANGWQDSGRALNVTFDANDGRANPLHDKVWQYFRQQMQANGGELSIALIEQVIVDRQLLSDWA